MAIDIDAPESVALNSGTPRPFPRVNGYLLVAVDDGFLVGQVEWMTIERSPFPARRGTGDFGLVDLPYPPSATAPQPSRHAKRANRWTPIICTRYRGRCRPLVQRSSLPTETQLRSIVESGDRRRVKIGSSPIAADADVCVDPNRLFGRHLAVLGNTGSGKSCSVAGLIRWSLEQAQRRRTELSRTGNPNARFIVLDPNGEYARAFGQEDPSVRARVFKVRSDGGHLALKVPLWFWNSSEWCSFTHASARTQRPLLRRALREVKAGRTTATDSTDEEKKLALRRYLSSRLISIQGALRSGEIQTDESKFGFRLHAIAQDLAIKSAEYPKQSHNRDPTSHPTSTTSNIQHISEGREDN